MSNMQREAGGDLYHKRKYICNTRGNNNHSVVNRSPIDGDIFSEEGRGGE